MSSSDSIGEITIGSDEAGKGEWLGPMTISAVALTRNQSSLLLAKGVIDSKQLSLGRVRALASEVKRYSTVCQTVTIAPQRFNVFLMEIRKEGKSLNDMLAWGHSKAITEAYDALIQKKIQVERVRIVIDQFDRIKTEKRLGRLWSLPGVTIEQRPEAEEETPVASAGIVARDAREQWIDEQSAKMKLDLRKFTVVDAAEFPEASLIAKTSFLKPRSVSYSESLHARYMKSQKGLFDDQQARDQYLEEVRQRAIKTIGLPVGSDQAEVFEKKNIILPDSVTWSTPDNSQTRERLASEIISEVQNLVQLYSITNLRTPGLKFEVQRIGVQYVLVASVWH